MRFEGDLVALLYAVAQGQSDRAGAPHFSDISALTIVMAANGYPNAPQKGGTVKIGDVGTARVFHAGTSQNGDVLIASGGRVLNVTASGGSVTEARNNAYAAISAIDFPGGFYRTDIGWRETAREAGL